MNAQELIRNPGTLAFAIACELDLEPIDLETVKAAIEYIQQHEQLVRPNEQMPLVED